MDDAAGAEHDYSVVGVDMFEDEEEMDDELPDVAINIVRGVDSSGEYFCGENANT